MSQPDSMPPPDTLTQRIGVLVRRETEARILSPVIEALANAFGREAVIAVVRDAIVKLAQEQGGELAETMGGNSPSHFMDSLAYWMKDDALTIEVLEQTDRALSFDVTRCRYAELYRALDIPELGAVFSCNRDYALIDGFNPDATLTRTQTIMEGAPCCDFRYQFQAAPDPD